MKNINVMKVGLFTLLVSAGLPSTAYADEAISDADILKYPTNSIEIGSLYIL